MVFAERAFRDKMNTLADCAVVSLMHVDRMRVLSVMLLHEVSHLAHVLKAPPGHVSREARRWQTCKVSREQSLHRLHR